MKKVLLFASCAFFLALSSLTTQAADPVGGKVILPEGAQLPKQGWICKRAYAFIRTAGTAYSQLKCTDNSILVLYDDGFERMAQGASDNYLLFCYNVLSNGTFNNAYTY